MERKAHNSLNEAALQVQLDEKFMSPINAFKTLRNTTGKRGKKVDAQLGQYGNRGQTRIYDIDKKQFEKP